jgi:hypothetical protein
MFEFSRAMPGDEVTAADVVVALKMFGAPHAYLFDRDFFDEFEKYISDRIHAIDESREDFETPHEHLERIGCEFEVFDSTEDGVWDGGARHAQRVENQGASRELPYGEASS